MLHREYYGLSFWADSITGYISLRRLVRDETRWFFTRGREFGLWYLTVHGFGLHFSVIGPFGIREVSK